MDVLDRIRSIALCGVTLATLAATSACAATTDDAAEETDSAVTLNGAARSVLLLPLPYDNDGKPTPDHWAFQDAARQLASAYAARGAAVTRPNATELTGDPASVFTYLSSLKNANKRFDRVIFLGHGGADGPTFNQDRAQIGYDWPTRISRSTSIEEKQKELDRNFGKFVELGALLNAVTTPGGLVYIGSCRPGQPTNWDSGGKSFVEALACVSGRQTAGRIGTTSWADAVDVVLKLEARDVPSRSNFAYANDGPNKCTSLPRPIAKADPTGGPR